MKIYSFSGLGADQRVFSLLKLSSSYEIVNIGWIPPKASEGIKAYSLRISKIIETNEPFGLLGLSFGGLIVQEISLILKPKITIVISSINSKSQIPFALRVLPNFILKSIPIYFFKVPKPLSNYIFSAQKKDLLHQIIGDTDPEFVKWALFAFKNWKEEQNGTKNVFFVSGEKDRLFKPIENAVVVKNGGHFMVVDLADKLSVIINDILVNN